MSDPHRLQKRPEGLVFSSEERLAGARASPEACRRDEATHRRAMTTVFVLEDTLFTLIAILDDYQRAGERGVHPPDADAGGPTTTADHRRQPVR